MNPATPTLPEDGMEEIFDLVETLNRTEQRLEELTGGEVDSIVDRQGQTFFLRRAQEELRSSESFRQAAILNALPAQIALLDTQGIIVSVNESWRRFATSNVLQGPGFGVGTNYVELCERAVGECSEEAQAAAKGIRKVLLGEEKEFALEYPCHSPTEKRWFRLVATPVHSEHLAGAVVMHLNITERRLADDSLRESEDRFRGTFEQAAVGVAHVSAEGRYLRVNDKFCEIVGYSREEMLAMTFVELTVSEDQERSQKARDSMLAGERPSYSIEKRYRRKDGAVIWVNLVTTLQRDATGKPTYSISVFQDITERKRVEAELDYERDLLRTLLDNSPDHIYFKDTQSRFIKSGQAQARQFGVDSPDQLVGKTDFDFFSESRARSAFEDEQGIIRTGRPMIAKAEMELWRDGRTESWVLTNKMPLRDKEGKIIGTFGISKDITAIKKIETELTYERDLLKALLDNVPDTIYFKDLQSRFVRVSKSKTKKSLEIELARHFTSHPAGSAETLPVHLMNLERFDEYLMGKTDFDLVSGEKAREFYEQEQEVIRTGMPLIGKLVLTTIQDDTEEWIIVSRIPWRDKDGKIIGTFGISKDITALKQVETELAYQSDLFATLMDHSPDSIFFKDLQSRFVALSRSEVNHLWQLSLNRHTPHPAGEKELLPPHLASVKEFEKYIIGKSDAEFYGPERAVDFDRDEKEVMRTGQMISGKVERTIYHDGSDSYYMVTKIPWRNKDGKIIGTFGTGKNITELKRAEAAAEETSALLDALLQNTQDHIYFKDLESRFIHFSREMLRHFHLSHPDELKGRTDFEFFSDEHARPAFEAEQEIIRTGKPMLNLEEKETHLDGEIAWVLSSKMPRHDKAGNIIGTMGISKDITERKRTEARYHRLIDSNAQSVFFWNKNGIITGSNDAFLGLIGYSREERDAGRIKWSEITPPKFAELDRQALDEVAATGACKSYEKEFIHKDGSRVPILIGAASFEDSPNEGVCFVLDLSERKKLETQFLRAQRMESIGTLAGGIAHDLNNILAPIMMSIDILKLSATDPQTASVLETIRVSAKRGADIVRQVLSFARGIEGERLEVQPKHLLKDLEHIIKDTFPKDIRLHFSIPDNIRTFLGDPTQIHQILLNLCVNARDAMPNGGSLTVSVENSLLDEQYLATNIQAKAGRYVLISVTDSGTGIPPGVLDKIFEPFFTTKDLNKGTGLGLSTVMAIVKSHDGIINVYSEPNKGTIFKVYLPAQETASDGLKHQTQSINLPRGNGETILVVDDEASVLAITGKTLQAFGYRVLTAPNGANAIAVYAEHKNAIAVVLTDMMMPIMDGPATIQALMQINPAVKIIASSGLNTNDNLAKISGAGLKHFLTKPYTAGTLLKTLRTILDEA